MLMPRPHQKHLVLAHENLDSPYLRAPKTTAPLQAYRFKPELDFGFFPLHVNMWRFVSIRRIEEEPVGPGSKNSRQRFQCTCSRDKLRSLNRPSNWNLPSEQEKVPATK